MSKNTIAVILPNGSKGLLHPGTVKVGEVHGFVYASGKRVYGTATWQRVDNDAFWNFVPCSKHAQLVGAHQLVSV